MYHYSANSAYSVRDGEQTSPSTETSPLLRPTVPVPTGSWISSAFNPLVGRAVHRLYDHVRSATKFHTVAHCPRPSFVEPTLFIYRVYCRPLISRQYHLLPDEPMAADNASSSVPYPPIASDICSASDPEKCFDSKTSASSIRSRRVLLWSGVAVVVAAIIALGKKCNIDTELKG